MVFTFTSSDGLIIEVGQNSNENDILVKKSEKGDLWFHLDDTPSPHVILKLNSKNDENANHSNNNYKINNEEDISESIKDCLQLLKNYSKEKNQSKSKCAYIDASKVTKPRGFPSGMVLLKDKPHVKSVSNDEERLTKLLATKQKMKLTEIFDSKDSIEEK